MARLIGRMIAAVLLSAILLFVVAQIVFAGLIWWYGSHAPGSTAFMSYRMGELHDKKPDAAIRYTWVPYEKISRNLKRALIASEDSTFVDHEGFDWDGIQLAIEKNRAKGKTVAGGSTISSYTAITAANQALWSTGAAQGTFLTVTTDVRVQNLFAYPDPIGAGTTSYTDNLTYLVVAQ